MLQNINLCSYSLCALRNSAIKSANPPTIMRASTTQDTGDASPVTGALAFTVVFSAACVPPFGWTFVMPAVGVDGVGVMAEPVVLPSDTS